MLCLFLFLSTDFTDFTDVDYAFGVGWVRWGGGGGILRWCYPTVDGSGFTLIFGFGDFGYFQV